MRNIRWNFSWKTGKATTGIFHKRIGQAVAAVALVGICSFAVVQEKGARKYAEAYERVALTIYSEDEKDNMSKGINIPKEDESRKKIHTEEYTPIIEPYVFLSQQSEEVKRKQREIIEQQIAEAVAEQAAEEAAREEARKAAAREEARKVAKEKNRVRIHLSKQDKNVLLRIVEAEATGEDIRGKMLVANVVLNRVNNKKEFPNNVTDVVFDHSTGVYQFSPILDGRYWSVEITEETREAVDRVLRGEDLSQGALYFMARKYADPDNVVWFDNSLTWLFAYGEHEFFR